MREEEKSSSFFVERGEKCVRLFVFLPFVFECRKDDR